LVVWVRDLGGERGVRKSGSGEREEWKEGDGAPPGWGDVVYSRESRRENELSEMDSPHLQEMEKAQQYVRMRDEDEHGEEETQRDGVCSGATRLARFFASVQCAIATMECMSRAMAARTAIE
jgi:hypothetical protein